jgi:NAD(P)-dependent dehydrogenase (short-subunit alcohol dehydrogenase family)
MKLDDSISAVVTGGASGLGAATARMLASHGVKVAIFDVNEDLGEAFAHEIGGVFCKADVTSTPAVEAAFAKARVANGQALAAPYNHYLTKDDRWVAIACTNDRISRDLRTSWGRAG